MNVAIACALVATLLEPRRSDEQPPTSIAITFAAFTSNAAAVSVGDGGRIRVDAIWVVMHDVRVRPCKRDSSRPLVPGVVGVELVSKTRSAHSALVAAGRYCALAVNLRAASTKVDGAPAELRAASIVVTGKRADGTRFVLQSRVELETALRVKAIDGLEVTGTTSWIVGVDIARWFRGLDLDVGEPRDGVAARVIRIDAKNNPELLATFDANVAKGFALFDDTDKNRILDDKEQQRPISN